MANNTQHDQKPQNQQNPNQDEKPFPGQKSVPGQTLSQRPGEKDAATELARRADKQPDPMDRSGPRDDQS